MAGLNTGGGAGAGGVRAGRAYVEFGANDRPLHRSINNLQSRFRSFGSVVGGIGRTIGKGFALGIGFGIGAAGAGSLLSGFKGLREEIDEIVKSSRDLDISTEKLSGIAHAANLSGIKTAEMRVAFTRFRKEVSGPLDEALFDLADRYKNTEDAGDRARLLTENFGKSGLVMGRMMRDGSVGIKAMIAEAKRLGATFDEQGAQKIENVNDALTRVKANIKGAFVALLVENGEALEKMVEDGGRFVKEFLIPAVDWTGRLVGGLTAAANAAKDLGNTSPPGGTRPTSFWDALPKAEEIGPAIGAMVVSQEDAARDVGRRFDDWISRQVGTPHSLRLFSDRLDKRKSVFELTDQYLQKVNESPPPPALPPGPTGIVSGWVEWSRGAKAAAKLSPLITGARTALQELIFGPKGPNPWRNATEAAANLNRFADSVRGGFGGALAGQQFGRGERVQDQQLDALRGIHDEVGELNEKAVPLVFG